MLICTVYGSDSSSEKSSPVAYHLLRQNLSLQAKMELLWDNSYPALVPYCVSSLRASYFDVQINEMKLCTDCCFVWGFIVLVKLRKWFSHNCFLYYCIECGICWVNLSTTPTPPPSPLHHPPTHPQKYGNKCHHYQWYYCCYRCHWW